MAPRPIASLLAHGRKATDLLPHTNPDSVVALQTPAGSGVLCLEIDEATEHGPDIRDKLARYAHGC